MIKKNCQNDPTLLHEEMTKQLHHIAGMLQDSISAFGQNDIRILNDLEEISKEFAELETLVSTYFLNCLLSEYTSSSSELSRAVHRMSLKGQEALIVLEKSDPVAPYIKGGTAINAQISSPLLESIFHPGSRLQSGAVLIQADKVVSAGNMLPVTEQIFWDRLFDINEASAVGLSERCDALILLVSGKGATSFCLDGNIYPFSTA
ncbi:MULTISPECIES: diadenylate cyclase [Paenibacillus]|uniref:DAC domain-containing protein n=1 Tax=Paenibacillus albilobatus TaxID=2716884 RepID=A0A920C8W6_9BACL|nr:MULTISPECIES: diadenylate cyclase [Paenibacillus]GIO29173.1 hypothetical protein J2TS6_03140 [Paenibacillus albilobatus]